MSIDSRGHVPAGPWAFDEGVTECFDDMLRRSIPQHDEMRATVTALTKRFATQGSTIVDLGCSRGEALALVIEELGNRCSYVGLEVSPPMIAAARERFASNMDVAIVEHDLRRGVPRTTPVASVALSVLTLQFTPIEYRQAIVASVYDALALGGAFIMVEKILGSTARIDAALVEAFYDRKRANGYSDDEIDRKRHALEGVLVPVTARWNEDLLRSAGFDDVDCIWRSLNFAGWLAFRRR
jgi:tRNA (cmo5U34)-methyltransferase